MESHRIKIDEVGYNRFTMTPNRWKKDFNAIGIIPSSEKYSIGTFAHPDIAFEFASWLNIAYANEADILNVALFGKTAKE